MFVINIGSPPIASAPPVNSEMVWLSTTTNYITETGTLAHYAICVHIENMTTTIPLFCLDIVAFGHKKLLLLLPLQPPAMNRLCDFKNAVFFNHKEL